MISQKKIPLPGRLGFWIGLMLFMILALFPLPLDITPEQKSMIAVLVLMAAWWMTEAIPLGITALLPVVLYPILGIMSTPEVAPNYMHHLIFLFLGGFLIATAFQKWELHRRFALSVLRILGSRPRNIILAFMMSSALLSMWISNTATAMMMFPIALAVIQQVRENTVNKKEDNFATILMLGIAYGCSIGGISTLIGTPPNIVFSGIFEKYFPALPALSFVNWMFLILPLSLFLFILIWLYLSFVILKTDPDSKMTARHIFDQKYRELGKMSVHEKGVLVIFFLTAALWIFRSDIQLTVFTIPGWPGLFGIDGWIQDSTIAVAMSLLLFIIHIPGETVKIPLLQIEDLKEIPWDILLLFGGGFALAGGMQESGLTELIGQQLRFLQFVPLFALILFLAMMVTFLTELSSNTAIATTVLPIAAALAIEIGLNPLVIMLPATIASSCAFMLPVATPPNAIVFGSRLIRIQDMVKIGLALNILAALTISIYFYLII